MTEDLVKIKSDNPAHPKGFYIQFRCKMKPGDIEYTEDIETEKPEAVTVKTENKPIKKRKKT